MAVGVPETDVFAAADAVLARGERPTVERVRLELGRGSPARVGGLLDLWWARLAERLSGETRLPALPREVSQAFVQVWQQAIHLAQGAAEQSLSAQRQVLIAEREKVAEAEGQARRDSAISRQRVAEEASSRQAAEARLVDLDVLLVQRQRQIDDMLEQRAVLATERDQALQGVSALQEQLKGVQLKAEQNRITQDTYVRGVEERAYREVDRAREERKATLGQLKSAGRQLEALQRRLEALQGELKAVEQQAVAQKARADTLEQQLASLHGKALIKRKPRARKASDSKI